MSGKKKDGGSFSPGDLSKMTPGTKGVMAEKLAKIIDEVLDNPED